MKKNDLNKLKNSQFLLLSSIGIVLFIALYGLAAWLYPGGSDVDQQATSFSWRYNYWCELLNPTAQNGQVNEGYIVAFIATLVLAIAISLSWIGIFPYLPFKETQRRYFQFSGMLSMIVALFIFTPLHDFVILFSGSLSLFTLVALFVGLYRIKAKRLLWLGCAVLLLMAINNLIYFTGVGLSYLALLQKFTFIVVLFWVLLLNRHFMRCDI
ncbi:MAG: hypothetical protein AAF849_22900 [Bacteroidota bacterium]